MNFLSKLTGSFSQPCAENPTVAMVEAAYQHHQMDWRYLNCEVAPADLGDAVRGARAMGWAGFNCSIPHKEAVIPFLDRLGESAALIGAVNCVVRKGDELVGENTDGKGFLKSLQEKLDPRGKSIFLLGAGGAARAIAVETALAGARQITILNRNLERAEKLAQLLNEKTATQASAHHWNGGNSIPSDADVVINATSVGLAPDVQAIPDINLDSLLSSMLVADVIPNPPRTAFLQAAEQRGCTVIDGLGMLVNQGVAGIQFWSGVTVDPEVMRAKLVKIFSS